MSKLTESAIKLSIDQDYLSWLREIKAKVLRLQIKASLAVNVELISFYWDLGRDIVEKQLIKNWGDAVIDQLSKDLQSTFPENKGFSRRNLFYIKR